MNKVVIAIGYLGGSLLAFLSHNAHWVLSFVFGPMEHLSLAVHQLDNGNEYLDGQARITGSDYMVAGVALAVWLAGCIGCLVLPTNKKPWVRFVLLLFWLVVGAVNVYLFSIRSV